VARQWQAAGAIFAVGKAVLTLHPPLRPLSHNVNPRDGAQDIAGSDEVALASAGRAVLAAAVVPHFLHAVLAAAVVRCALRGRKSGLS
jgi:hypothetical protein